MPLYELIWLRINQFRPRYALGRWFDFRRHNEINLIINRDGRYMHEGWYMNSASEIKELMNEIISGEVVKHTYGITRSFIV